MKIVSRGQAGMPVPQQQNGNGRPVFAAGAPPSGDLAQRFEKLKQFQAAVMKAHKAQMGILLRNQQQLAARIGQLERALAMATGQAAPQQQVVDAEPAGPLPAAQQVRDAEDALFEGPGDDVMNQGDDGA